MDESTPKPNPEQKCPQCGASLPAGALEGLCPACLLKEGAAPDTSGPPDSAAFHPPTVAEVSVLFPQLEIISFIGKGGMGAVYKARQPALDRVVALKILAPQTAASAGFAERFNREARALARLNHPNIVAVYEFGQVNALPFLIMEFVDGLNLRQLELTGRLSPAEALQIVPQICQALQFAHDEGVVHRDIKPENLLMDKKGRVKIADFGIAKIMGRSDLAPNMIETQGAIGTPHYMAPEQMEKPQTVDHRADIFSLGVVFYEMLTGELPLGKFLAPSRKVQVDVRLDEVVFRALEKEPERRYQHASQIKTAVETIASTPGAPPPIQPAPPLSESAAVPPLILDHDYHLNIGSCLRRGAALVRADFWPMIGLTALLMILTGITTGTANSQFHSNASTLLVLFIGPIFGGLYLHLLKKIRKQPTRLETVFSGFSNRFAQLLVGGVVVGVLTGLGFVCFVLPGIYLFVAWSFTLPLIMDQQMDFWPAMELSRKTISRHWWKFFCFFLVLALVNLLGFAALFVGFLFTFPVTLAALMFAYEDILNSAPVATGPSGTIIMPPTPPKISVTNPIWQHPAAILAAIALLIIVGLHYEKSHARNDSPPEVTVAPQASSPEEEGLKNRLDAASMIQSAPEKNDALAAIATNAAAGGEISILQDAFNRIDDPARQNEIKQESVRLLAAKGLRGQALEIARTISDDTLRDQTLAELAR